MNQNRVQAMVASEHCLSTIIFLDIDGVLAFYPAGWKQRLRSGQKPRRVLHVDAIERFNRLCAETASLVVVSSTWRLHGDVRPHLAHAGLTAPFHADWCTDEDGPTRGDEITRWLQAHDAGRYVVLDDRPEGLEAHASHLVQPHWRVGLLDHDVARAIEILRGCPDLTPANGGHD
ncbi:HAD domain-containing protein [Roseomonas sp. NAR14]|uniref:HAD domain-containing protein n=1 Tax=Roseomonas acroporae TaxID=2937791 RepID=A0A9X1YIC4_9PROT|nr:HAD domain-containing protein [Roseomonas acroporae]